MTKISVRLNQHKTITIRKIMKLRKIKKTKKIKKRKIKTSKTSIDNIDHGIKIEENKIKKNESNSGENLIIHRITYKEKSLSEERFLYRNGSGELYTNIGNNNINTQNNFIRSDDIPSILSEQTSTRSVQEEPKYNFLPVHRRDSPIFYNTSSYFTFEDVFEREYSHLYPTSLYEQESNINELDFENQNNNRFNFPSINTNSPNRNDFIPQNINEFIPQNRNTNNSNRNIMHLNLDIPFDISNDFSFRLTRINPTEISNIINKLPKNKFRKSESSDGNSEKCIICYEDFKNNQDVYSLPCHHLFHVECLNEEIKYRQKCPTCRHELK